MIGEGNFGVVCKMEHELSGTMMAVKVIQLSIRSEHKFCTFFVHQQRTGANKVELLVHSEVDAEFYGESFGNKT